MTPFLTSAVLALVAAAPDTTLLQFSSQRCQHCQSMQPIVSQLAQQGVNIQVIDVDRQLSVAQQHRISGVPTFVAVSGGQEVGRIEGVTTAEKLATLVGWAPPTNKAASATYDSMPPGPGPRAPSPLPPDQSARAATVRIKVEDTTGYGFGTGTIIDTHENEALVVTCGHLFRESKGQGKITADVFTTGSPQTVDGQLIGYDLDRDIALISVKSGPNAQAAKVAPPGFAVRPGDRAFSIGCDKGAEPSIRPTHITAVNKYKGKPNFTAAGQPIDGRSGGGLFSAEGYLIGICNAADPRDDEGLYAGLASIHWQLDQIGQAEIYQRSALAASPAALAPPMSTAAVATPSLPPANAIPTSATIPNTATAPADRFAQAAAIAPIAAGDDTEIVFIVRSKRDPSQRSEVYVVDQAAPDLLARITRAAQATGEQRAALARNSAAQFPGRTAAASARSSGPVVRGQSSDY
jgi:S1-C subfamily serine protease